MWTGLLLTETAAIDETKRRSVDNCHAEIDLSPRKLGDAGGAMSPIGETQLAQNAQRTCDSSFARVRAGMRQGESDQRFIILVGAVERSANCVVHQWLAERCGRKSTFGAQREISLTPTPSRTNSGQLGRSDQFQAPLIR
jgi:hypothetical protein